jgi:Xaa-Pro aminopeptidase
VSVRVDRLRELLEEPLLVTNPANVFYLVGFKSSNAAVLVEQDRVRLFTDFRYAEAARAVEGVELEMTKRGLLADLSARLSGRIGFEADYMSYGGWETLGAGSVEPVPRRTLVERLRAVKDDSELATIREACAISDRMFERLAEEKFVGRTELDLAWRIEELFHEEGSLRSRASSRPGRTPRARMHAQAPARSVWARPW